MSLELYQEISLNRDFQENQLKAGDVAILVNFVSYPGSGREGCILEVFSALGESLTVVTEPLSAVEALRSDEIMPVRSFANVG